MIKMLLVFLIFMQPVAAQTTWHGLRFGMTEAEVGKQYQGTLQKVETEGLIFLRDSNQKLASWPAVADLGFDGNDKLNRISVYTKDPFRGASSETDATGSSFALISVLGDELTQKYGSPVTTKGDCGLTIPELIESDRNTFTCSKLWKVNDQTVEMYWSFDHKRLDFFSVSYQQLPSDI